MGGGSKNHLLIEGENYHALKVLQSTGLKVDIIYIDPPYNTGKEFVYNDNFSNDSKVVGSDDPHKHSKWLSFMKRRLTLAKDLLHDDGVIFVSIDDNEQAYLKVLMDEIFGENNFVANINWQSSFGGKNDNKLIPVNTEYILCYSAAKEFNKLKSNNKISKFKHKDPLLSSKYGNYSRNQLCRASLTWYKSLDYIIYIKNLNNTFSISFDDDGKSIGRICAGPNSLNFEEKEKLRIQRFEGNGNKNDWCYYWSPTKLMQAFKNGFIDIWKDKDIFKIAQKKFENAKFDGRKGKVTSYDNTLISLRNVISNSKITSKSGNDEAKDIFNAEKFSYPKPSSLLKLLFQTKNKDSKVLDFFAGSGTTAQAVMELNKDDGGNRRFILATNNEMKDVDTIKHPDKGIAQLITRERLYRVINNKGSNKEVINWTYKDVKGVKVKNALSNNSVAYLKVQYIHKLDGEFEDIDNIQKLFEREFDKKISIIDLHTQEYNE